MQPEDFCIYQKIWKSSIPYSLSKFCSICRGLKYFKACILMIFYYISYKQYKWSVCVTSGPLGLAQMSTSELSVKWSWQNIQSGGLLLSLYNKDTIKTMFQRKSLILFTLITWLTVYSECLYLKSKIRRLTNRLSVTTSMSSWAHLSVQ